MRKAWRMLLVLAALLALACGAAAEETVFEPADLPVVYLHIDGGEEEIALLNNPDNHNHKCTGTMDIVVPEGYSGGFEGRFPMQTVKDLKMRYIRGRGNGTWGMDKHPYKIKLEEKANLFGMGKSRTWVLLANYFDDSLIRNWLVSWMGEQAGLEYTPEGLFVEVVMDGEYLGNYYLCEQVGVSKHRVAIEELTEADTEFPAIQGGYLLEFHPDDEGSPDAFETSRGQPFGNMEPSFDAEDGGYENETQMNYIRNYIQQAEDAIYAEGGPIGDYLDLQSLADYWWIMEFTTNEDAFYTDSQHMFKPRYEADGSEGKLHFGPLWDFDASTGNGMEKAAQTPGFNNTTFVWMDALRQREDFRAVLKERWEVLDEKLEELVREGGALDRMAAIVRDSWYRDEAKWHTFKEERDMLPVRSFEDEITFLREWINLRRAWIREHLEELDVLTFTVTFRGEGVEEVSYEVTAYQSIDPYVYYEEEIRAEGKTFTGWALEDGTPLDFVLVDRDLVLTAQFE